MTAAHRITLLLATTLAGCAATLPSGACDRCVQADAPQRASAAEVASACADLPEQQQRAQLLGGALPVADAWPVVQRVGKHLEFRTLGAEVYVRAEPHVTAPWLQRVAHCQIVRYEAGELASAADPLAVTGAQVEVRDVGGGFVVRVTAPTRAGGRTIADRVAQL